MKRLYRTTIDGEAIDYEAVSPPQPDTDELAAKGKRILLRHDALTSFSVAEQGVLTAGWVIGLVPEPDTAGTAQEQGEGLELSIKHWDRMLREPLACIVRGEMPAASQCDLCKHFREGPDRRHQQCDLCPVRLRTGKRDCVGSPYSGAYTAWDKMKTTVQAAVKEWQRDGRAELDFLVSLRADIATTETTTKS